MWRGCLGGLVSLVISVFLVGGVGASGVELMPIGGVLVLLLTLRGGSYVVERPASF